MLPTSDELMAAIPAGTPTYWFDPAYHGLAAGPGLLVGYAEWSGAVVMLSYDRIDQRYAMPPALQVFTSPGESATSPANQVPGCADAGTLLALAQAIVRR